jgi:hypothetical protein
MGCATRNLAAQIHYQGEAYCQYCSQGIDGYQDAAQVHPQIIN